MQSIITKYSPATDTLNGSRRYSVLCYRRDGLWVSGEAHPTGCYGRPLQPVSPEIAAALDRAAPLDGVPVTEATANPYHEYSLCLREQTQGEFVVVSYRAIRSAAATLGFPPSLTRTKQKLHTAT
jgi:hypothetical protein